MKHYANHSSQNEPRRGAKPTGGKRYAPPEKKRDAIERDFFEKKPAELRIKRTSPAIETDPTKIFSVKQSDAAAGATQGKTEPDVYRKPLRRGDRADDVDVDSILRKHDALFASDLDEPDEARIPDFEEREIILDHEPGAAETAEAEQPAPQREERPKKAKTVCSGTPTAAAPPNKAGYLPAFVFAGFILTMSVLLLVLPKKDFSVAEKKQLAPFPEFSVEALLDGSYGKDGIKPYLTDHFPMRDFFVGVNAYAVLAEGVNGENGVYNCADGYLINKPISADNHIEYNLFILDDFKNYCLKEKGVDVPMTAMFVPSTGFIMENKLPLLHDVYNDEAFFAQFTDALSESGIGFVDIRGAFQRAAADGKQLYYKTDHHWTTEGAYTAYLEFCKQTGLQPAERSRFNVEKYDGFYGTTYTTGGFLLNESDTVEVWNDPANSGKIHVTITDFGEKAKTVNSDSMFFTSHADEMDKYPIFIDGNHALTEITNDNVEDGTIVVIKDSFSHCFAPFLAENYHKVILVDMRYYKQRTTVSDLVKAENPDRILVLYGMDNFATDMDLPSLE